MSLGIGAKCRRIVEDEKLAVYEYSVYNWNMDEHKDAAEIFDGVIEIAKSELEEPILREKIIKSSSGKKRTVIRRIHKDVDIAGLVKRDYIRIQNCSHCFRKSDENIDVMAIRLCSKIFEIYQDDSCLPESVTICS